MVTSQYLYLSTQAFGDNYTTLKQAFCHKQNGQRLLLILPFHKSFFSPTQQYHIIVDFLDTKHIWVKTTSLTLAQNIKYSNYPLNL